MGNAQSAIVLVHNLTCDYPQIALKLTCDTLPWMAALSRSICILGDMIPDACMKRGKTNLILEKKSIQKSRQKDKKGIKKKGKTTCKL